MLPPSGALNSARSHKSANLPTCHFGEAEANLPSFSKTPPDHVMNFSLTTSVISVKRLILASKRPKIRIVHARFGTQKPRHSGRAI
jgi:hypothetical protein